MPDWPGTPVQKEQPQWPGTPVSEQKQGGMSKLGEEMRSGFGYPERYKAEVASDIGEMKEGIGKIKEGQWFKGGVQAGLGALNYAYAPVSAGVHTVVGRPVETMTGSQYAGQVADIAGQAVLPFPLGFGGTSAPIKATKVGQAATKIVAPEILDEISGKAAALIRSETGPAARETAKTAERLKVFDPVRNSLDDASRIDLIDRMQNPNAPRSRAVSNVTHYEAELNNIFEDYADRLGKLPKGAQMRFRDYYFPNKWLKDPNGKILTPQGAGSAREGSGRFLKEQSMTLKEGLQKGYTPVTTDPTKATMIYAENVDKFIATEKIFDQAVRDRTIGYFRTGGKFTGPPQGWVPVQGRLGDKGVGGVWKAYAPESWARVYNNYISKGLESTQAADIYSALQKIENNMIMMKLGLSGYHATMETLYEGPASEFARGITELASGNIRRGLTGIVGSSLAAAKQYTAGRSLERAYLGDMSKRGQLFNYTGLSPEAKASLKEIADLYAKGGGRAVGGRMHSLGEYEFSRQGTYFQPSIRRYTDAFRQASNKMEALMQPGKDALHATMRVGREIWNQPWKQHPVVTFAKQIGRAMDTIAYPLFEKYIPRLKNGAFTEQMAGWLTANPGASQETKLAAARKIIDSVDNRFGEMIKDNLFMTRTMKQALQLATVSYSYEMGTIRELGGAALEAVEGKGGLSMKNPNWTPKQSYALALPVVSGTLAAMYQYMKTRKPPETAMDLVAPRTGGKNLRGEDERVTPIGYSKDLFNFMSNPGAWAAGKASPLLETVGELKSQHDWRGDPIVPVDQTGKAPTYEAITAWAKHVGEAYVPIAVETMGKRSPDTNIGLIENLLGARSAGMKYTDPKGLDQLLRDKAVQEEEARRKHNQEEPLFIRSRKHRTPHAQ